MGKLVLGESFTKEVPGYSGRFTFVSYNIKHCGTISVQMVALVCKFLAWCYASEIQIQTHSSFCMKVDDSSSKEIHLLSIVNDFEIKVTYTSHIIDR